MLKEKNGKKILLLTLVHPDLLPPVYAIAQVLRDAGYSIHILTFDSIVPFPKGSLRTVLDLGSNIILESAGRHYDAGAIERIRLRNKFKKRALQLAKDKSLPIAIGTVISFCPFSFHTGIIIKSRFKIPLLYHALELSDFPKGSLWDMLSAFLRSPLSNYRNLRALQALSKADIIATPSVQRSAWLAGRGHLSIMPYTILNTAYLSAQLQADSYDTFRKLVPANFPDKKMILYTGAVNADTCILELIRAFELVNDGQSALIINGLKDDEYAAKIKLAVSECTSKNRILLLPYLTRDKVMALQEHAHIGASLMRGTGNNLQSKMVAPNKVGEYMAKNLLILGITNDYLRPFEMMGMAVLSPSPEPVDMAIAIKKALVIAGDQPYKIKIRKFVEEFFCMQQQLKPFINFIDQTEERE
jgi:hypothetical protein